MHGFSHVPISRGILYLDPHAASSSGRNRSRYRLFLCNTGMCVLHSPGRGHWREPSLFQWTSMQSMELFVSNYTTI